MGLGWLLRVGGIVLLMGSLGGVLGGAWKLWKDRREVQVRIERVLQLEDSLTQLTAVLTTARVEKDSLRGLLAAARALDGKLIAGVKIQLPERDTLIVHDTLTTYITNDSTRTAAFRDSTFAGVVEGTVVAPPYPAPLGLSYRFTRTPFGPTVGLIRSGTQHYAVVTWAGEQVEVPVAFADVPLPEPRLAPYLDAAWNPQGGWRAESGVQLRVNRHWFPYGAVEVRDGRDPGAWVGVRYRW